MVVVLAFRFLAVVVDAVVAVAVCCCCACRSGVVLVVGCEGGSCGSRSELFTVMMVGAALTAALFLVWVFGGKG